MVNEPIQVLLADDNEDDRLFFADAFEEIGTITVVNTVMDGYELINHLSMPDAILPHILFLDLAMPRKSGLECLREIKSNNLFKDMAIAIYSKSSAEEDIEDAFVSGANIYIMKPNHFNTMKVLLSKVIATNLQFGATAIERDSFVLGN